MVANALDQPAPASIRLARSSRRRSLLQTAAVGKVSKLDRAAISATLPKESNAEARPNSRGRTISSRCRAA